jgi:hypothetical protein
MIPYCTHAAAREVQSPLLPRLSPGYFCSTDFQLFELAVHCAMVFWLHSSML